MTISYRNVRRVVTGHDASGKSVFISDAPVKAIYERPGTPGRGMADIWRGARVPTPIGEGDDITNAGPVVLLPPKGGYLVRIVEIPPDSESSVDQDYFEGMGAGKGIRQEASRHPGMHKTPTLDVIAVMSGEVWALLEDSEMLLRQGDFLVQRATLHAWSNRSDQPCVLMGLLVDADAS